MKKRKPICLVRFRCFTCSSFFWVLLFGITLRLSAQEVEVAGDLQLTGILGKNLKIEMLLQSSKQIPFFALDDAKCLDVEGYYVYCSQIRPISVKGQICPQNGNFSLDAYNESRSVTERFEGTWNVAQKTINGNWTLLSSGKKLPFALSALENIISVETQQAYYAFLRYLIQGGGDVEGAEIDDAQWTQKGCTITNFKPGWYGGINFFAPLRLEYYTGYSSTARSSYQGTHIQLLPCETGFYFLYYGVSSGYDKYYDVEGEQRESDGTCGYSIQIYQLVGEDFEDVTEKVWQSKAIFDTGYETKNRSGLACECRIISDGILLPTGEKLWWDGSKFSEKK